MAVTYFEYRSTQFSKTIVGFTLVMCVWVIMRHRSNIKRLSEGTEQQLSTSSSEPGEPDAGTAAPVEESSDSNRK